MLRRSSAFLLAVATTLTVVATAGAAFAGPGESDFTSRANAARSSAGRARYRVAADLVAVARRHSARMAARGDIWHNGSLSREVSGWQMVGENVGVGGSVSAIHQAFMNSASHRANILDRDFTEIGVGTVVGKNGAIYVTQVFRLPSRRATTTASRPTATRSTTRTAARPAPARPSVRPAVRPAARPAARAVPAATLRSRVARVSALRRQTRPGVVPQAVAYVTAMQALVS